MKGEEIAAQLETIAPEADFAARSAMLTEGWLSGGVGVEAVEPILRFMEDHPGIDFGMPGALVHFIERFYGSGYEDKLIESLSRRPTVLTAWMLNRIINGTKAPQERRRLIAAMQQASTHPLADASARQRINHFLQRLAQ